MRRRILLQLRSSGPDYSDAALGDIFCSDGTIETYANYPSSGKTGVAVVLMNTAGEGKLRLISNNVYSGSGVSWGPNTATVSGMTNYANETALSGDSSDSKTNTDLMIAQYGNAVTHASGYARSLSKDGLPVGSFGVMSYTERMAYENGGITLLRSLMQIGGAPPLPSNPRYMISAQNGVAAWFRETTSSVPITSSWTTYAKTATVANNVIWPVAIIEY